MSHLSPTIDLKMQPGDEGKDGVQICPMRIAHLARFSILWVYFLVMKPTEYTQECLCLPAQTRNYTLSFFFFFFLQK